MLTPISTPSPVQVEHSLTGGEDSSFAVPSEDTSYHLVLSARFIPFSKIVIAPSVV
ncbi:MULTISPECIES: hypothetical protein [Flavobacterium]|uniref:Uncharacterized protein n=1 Tax=Flavobacterium covae TaxID=2906076 RepID=A0ABW8PK83_9FLAO|nr:MULTISPECIES: hypothetical protein [Flavobacterium]